MEALKIFDWILLVLLLIFVINGFRKGFLGSVIQLLGIVLIFTVIGKFMPYIESVIINKYEFSPSIAHIASYMTLIIMSIIIIKFIIWLSNKVLSYFNLNVPNRIFGGVFGILTGLGFLLLFVSLINLIPDQRVRPLLVKNSNYYLKIENYTSKFVREFEEKIDASTKSVKDTVKDINHKIDPEEEKNEEMEDVVKDIIEDK